MLLCLATATGKRPFHLNERKAFQSLAVISNLKTQICAPVFCVLLLGVCLFTAACQKQAVSQSELTVEYEMTPQPPRVGTAIITLKLVDLTGKPISGASVSLEGNMSHAGMRPVFGEAREQEPGRYHAPLEFTMGGDWVILLYLTLPDGRKLERQIDVKGVKSS